MAQRFDRKNCLNTKAGRTSRWAFWLLGIAGLLSLVWFLIRVIPRPSRAAYPCQRVAAPLAGGFVVWALGLLGSVSAFAKAKRNLRRSRYIIAGLCVALSVASLWLALSLAHDRPAKAEQPGATSRSVLARGSIQAGLCGCMTRTQPTGTDLGKTMGIRGS